MTFKEFESKLQGLNLAQLRQVEANLKAYETEPDVVRSQGGEMPTPSQLLKARAVLDRAIVTRQMFNMFTPNF